MRVCKAFGVAAAANLVLADAMHWPSHRWGRHGLRPATQLPWLWGVLLVFTPGCRCGTQARDEQSPAPAAELKLLEPEEESEVQKRGRCAMVSGRQWMLRSRVEQSAEPVSVEVGGGALLQGNVALFAQRLAGTAQAFVALSGPGGTLREIGLGQLHGSTDPPTALLHEGALFGVVSGNEAMGQTLQVVRIDDPWGKAEVVRGPMISTGRDDSLVASLAIAATGSAVLTWDQFDRSSARSRIWSQSFDAATLVPRRAAQPLSGPQVDAEEPRLEAGPGGFFLSYVELDASKVITGAEALVDEPARALRVQQLDTSGAVSAPALAISEATEQLLAFDTLVTGGKLYVAYRSGARGNTMEEEVIHLVRVGADGAIERGVAQHPLLGPGAPMLLGAQRAGVGSVVSDEVPWLLARGDETETLLAELTDFNRVELASEPALSERLPLGRYQSQLLALRAVGLDWAVEIADCAPAKTENPSAKPGGK